MRKKWKNMSLTFFISTLIFFILASFALNYAFDSFGASDSTLRAGLIGGLSALFWIIFFKTFLTSGKKLGLIDQNAKLPWDD